MTLLVGPAGAFLTSNINAPSENKTAGVTTTPTRSQPSQSPFGQRVTPNATPLNRKEWLAKKLRNGRGLIQVPKHSADLQTEHRSLAHPTALFRVVKLHDCPGLPKTAEHLSGQSLLNQPLGTLSIGTVGRTEDPRSVSDSLSHQIKKLRWQPPLRKSASRLSPPVRAIF